MYMLCTLNFEKGDIWKIRQWNVETRYNVEQKQFVNISLTYNVQQESSRICATLTYCGDIKDIAGFVCRVKLTQHH
jgi:hypothetical protein